MEASTTNSPSVPPISLAASLVVVSVSLMRASFVVVSASLVVAGISLVLIISSKEGKRENIKGEFTKHMQVKHSNYLANYSLVHAPLNM